MVAKQIAGSKAPDGSTYSTLTDGVGNLGAGTFSVQATPAGGPTAGTHSTVASSATSVTILASNASRKGATVYNDSTQILYLGLSATAASTSAYSVQLAAGGFYEVPFFYTGQLTGIWASANGNARVTELA